MSKKQFKEHSLPRHNPRFPLSNTLPTSSLRTITSPDFFECIISRYRLRQFKASNFPILVFFKDRQVQISPCLPSGNSTTILRPGRTYSLSLNLLFTANLLSTVPYMTANDREKQWLASENRPGRSSMGTEYPFIHRDLLGPIFRLGKAERTKAVLSDGQITVEGEVNKAEALYGISRYGYLLANGTFLTRNGLHFQKYKASLTPHKVEALASISQKKTHFLSREVGWKVAHSRVNESMFKRKPPKIESALSWASIPFSSDIGFRTQKSPTGAKRHDSLTAIQHFAPGRAGYYASELVPTLNHLAPTGVAYDDLKKEITSIKRRTLEVETSVQKPILGHLSISHKEPSIPWQANYSLDYLTDKVYQMLERKIKVERERRGF